MQNFMKAFVAGLSATVAIGVLAYLRERYGYDLWLMAPFGATAVLVFGVPESPLAKPKNVILGHVFTSAIGLVFVHFIGAEFWMLALATGMGIFVMLATNTTHPPAGANPILIMLTQPAWGFLLNPVLFGASVIVLIGWLYAQLGKRNKDRWVG